MAPSKRGVGEGSGAAVYLAGAALRPVSRRAALALVGQCAGGVFSVLVAALTGAILWGREQMMGASRQLARSQAVDEVCEEALFTLRPDGKVSSWSRGAILLWEYGRGR